MFLDASVLELVELVYQAVQEVAVVGHDYQSSVVGLERLLEYVLGLYVHMVGGLVKRQQVVALEHQGGHCKTGSLPSAQHADALVDVLAAEEELRQQVAQAAADIAGRHSVQSAENGLVFVKYILLILSIVTYGYIMSYFSFTSYGVKLSGKDSHKGCLALAVAAYECHLLPSLYFDVSIAEHYFLRVARCEACGLEGHVSAARGGRKLYLEGGVVGLVYLQSFQFFQSLYTGLDLVGLGGFVTEAVYEVFRLLYHFLLVLVGGSLLRQPFGAKFHVLAVGYLVIVYVTKHNLNSAVGYVVQELAVVGNQHKAAFQAF